MTYRMTYRLTGVTAKDLKPGDRVRFVGGGDLERGSPIKSASKDAPALGTVLAVEYHQDGPALLPFVRLPSGSAWYLGNDDAREWEKIEGFGPEPAFCVVWNPSNPRTQPFRHITEAAAKIEADRLARKHPGQRFYVMRAVSSAFAEQTITMHTQEYR